MTDITATPARPTSPAARMDASVRLLWYPRDPPPPREPVYPYAG